MSRKPIVLSGSDAVFLRHTCQCYMNRDVIHLMHEYPRELEKLCGGLLVDGYDRNPSASPDIDGVKFKVCRDCFDASVKIQADKIAARHELIVRIFTNLHDSRGDMFDRGVIEVFRRLSWCYKTHNPFRFGKRVILTYFRNPVKGQAYGYLNHRVTDELDDLVRVFSVLDGKPEPDHRDSMWSRISGQERAEYRVGPENELDAEYFHIRWFRNGNGHLTFKRPDLVEKMNAIIGRHYPGALPAPR